MGAFSGRTISQGLLLAEVLGHGARRRVARPRPAGRFSSAPFDVPLLVFAAVDVRVAGGRAAAARPAVVGEPRSRVSVGQMLLVLWPIGVYFASAELLTAGRRCGDPSSRGAGVRQVACCIRSCPRRGAPTLPGCGPSACSPPRSRWRCAATAVAVDAPRLADRVVVIPMVRRRRSTARPSSTASVVGIAATMLWLRASRRSRGRRPSPAVTIALIGAFAGGERS